MVLRGDPGIGKTALLVEAAGIAQQHGMIVLHSVGVQSEMQMPFAALHELLKPLIGEIGGLPRPQASALESAFGISDASPPELFLVGLATLNLLGNAASRNPVLVISDDTQWNDRASATVLDFVSRRIDAEPILVVRAFRAGAEESGALYLGVELVLDPLDRHEASALLDDVAPGLGPNARERLLQQSAGNPLALIELSKELITKHFTGDDDLPERLPLTTRLERAFAARLPDLDHSTRHLLLVAALDDAGSLAEFLEAASAMQDEAIGEISVESAVAAGLIEVIDDKTVRFRHPLIRSAVVQASTTTDRRSAHAALARVIHADPDRIAWHDALAAVGPDEHAAVAMEAAAMRAQRRGAVAIAVRGLERAARLSEASRDRGSRLLKAAELSLELGQRDVAARLAREAESIDLAPIDKARSVFIRESVSPSATDSARVRWLIEVAGQASTAGEVRLALNLLRLAAQWCWRSDLDRRTRESVLRAATALQGSVSDLSVLVITAYTMPAERANLLTETLRTWRERELEDPDIAYQLGIAAAQCGELDQAIEFLDIAASKLRTHGRLGSLTHALSNRAFVTFLPSDWDQLIVAAEEAIRLGIETSNDSFVAQSQIARAMVASARGEADLAASLIAQVEPLALRPGNNYLQSWVSVARGLRHLDAGRGAEALGELHHLFDKSNRAHHYRIGPAMIADLADAAVRSGHAESARQVMESVEADAGPTVNVVLQASFRYARALLANDDEAESLFRVALDASIPVWPYRRARLLLAYGEWLRRRRRRAEARTPLREARDIFDGLRALPWSERARRELRAAGESSPNRNARSLDRLTAQELQIAKMAAEGLSNREIAQSLFLSPRTVGSHLYRLFPKLGITARHQLRRVLEASSRSSY